MSVSFRTRPAGYRKLFETPAQHRFFRFDASSSCSHGRSVASRFRPASCAVSADRAHSMQQTGGLISTAVATLQGLWPAWPMGSQHKHQGSCRWAASTSIKAPAQHRPPAILPLLIFVRAGSCRCNCDPAAAAARVASRQGVRRSHSSSCCGSKGHHQQQQGRSTTCIHRRGPQAYVGV